MRGRRPRRGRSGLSRRGARASSRRGHAGDLGRDRGGAAVSTGAERSAPGAEPAPAATATGPATPGAQQPSPVGEPGPTAPLAPREGYVEPDRELTGLTGWINHEPLTIGGLLAQGRVVLVDFWTYTCINCIRTLPYLRMWHEKYADRGLTILGIHSPEFDFERERANVIDAVERRGIEYPVAQDNEMATWRAFQNRAWPAKYMFGVDGGAALPALRRGTVPADGTGHPQGARTGGLGRRRYPHRRHREPAARPERHEHHARTLRRLTAGISRASARTRGRSRTTKAETARCCTRMTRTRRRTSTIAGTCKGSG